MKKHETLPTNKEANYLLLASHSMEGIKGILKQFPVLQRANSGSKGCSASVLWSGTAGNNVPITTYVALNNSDEIGFVLNPNRLVIPQADFHAQSSQGKLCKEFSKKDVRPANINRFHYTKAGYFRGPDVFTINIARHEYRSEGKSIYHERGSPEVYAKNVWRKFHQKKHRSEDNEELMRFSEGICYQKGKENPIDGLLITKPISVNTAREFLKIFEQNPHLRLYFYDRNAKDHIVRFYDNTEAQAYVKQIFQGSKPTPMEYQRAFEKATNFQGFSTANLNENEPISERELSKKIQNMKEIMLFEEKIKKFYKKANKCLPGNPERQKYLNAAKDAEIYHQGLTLLLKEYFTHKIDEGEFSYYFKQITETAKNSHLKEHRNDLKEILVYTGLVLFIIFSIATCSIAYATVEAVSYAYNKQSFFPSVINTDSINSLEKIEEEVQELIEGKKTFS